MGKIKITESPFSVKVSDERQQQDASFVEALTDLTTKYGIDEYLFSFKFKDNGREGYSSALLVNDGLQAAALLFEGQRVVKEYIKIHQPTAPGGTA